MKVTSSYLTFDVGSHQFCIPAERVVDINRHCDYTAVPGAPNAIKGILNLRGQLIVALDMNKLLQIEVGEALKDSVSIIVDVGLARISLLVDKVGDILQLSDETFESPPHQFSKLTHYAVIGAHKLSKSLLIVLDPVLFFNNLITDLGEMKSRELLPRSE